MQNAVILLALLMLTIPPVFGFFEDGEPVQPSSPVMPAYSGYQQNAASYGSDLTMIREGVTTAPIGATAGIGYGSLAVMGHATILYRARPNVDYQVLARQWNLRDDSLSASGTGFGVGAQLHSRLYRMFRPYLGVQLLNEEFTQKWNNEAFQHRSYALAILGAGVAIEVASPFFYVGFDRNYENYLDGKVTADPIYDQRLIDKERYVSRIYFEARF
jgi:hypothetical protein